MRADARGRLGALPLGAAQAPSTHNAEKMSGRHRWLAASRRRPFSAFRVPAKGLAPCTPRSRRGPGLQQQLQPETKKKEGPMTTPTLTQDALHQFTGTEHWYRHPLVRTVTYTDGAQYVAEHGGAYWLLDIIAIAQRHEKAVSAEPFQVWKLAVDGKQSGTVICEDGNGKEVYRQGLD